MLDDARSTQGKVIRDCPRLLPCADHPSSSMISHDGTAFFSPRISGMVLFFFVQVVKKHKPLQELTTMATIALIKK